MFFHHKRTFYKTHSEVRFSCVQVLVATSKHYRTLNKLTEKMRNELTNYDYKLSLLLATYDTLQNITVFYD